MWDAASTCQIVSIKSSAASSLGQAFGNITWNSPSQGNDVDFPSGLSAGGNFTVVTNPKYIRLNKTSSLRTVTVGGNMTIQGGLVVVAGDAGATTIVVDGSFSQSGGTFDLGEGNGAGLLQVKGNFSHSGGTLQRKNSSGTGTIEFGGSGIQDLIAGGNYPSGVESRVHFTVNTGSTLYLGANLLGGGGSGTSSGNFTLQSGATLGIGHSGGVTVSGASGNVRVTGTRNYSTAANYVYNGTSAQSAGNGLPTTVNNLTFNNPSSVTLGSNVVVANILSLMGGNITTGTNTLTLGTSTSSLGTLTRTSGTIVGNFRRWFAGVTASDVLFPVGTATYYRPADISFTVVPSTGGTLVSSFGASNPGFSGLPLVDSGVSIVDVGVDGYWTLVAGNGLSGGVYSLDLTADGFINVPDPAVLRILKRSGPSNPWALDGTHSSGTGSSMTPIAHRTDMSGFSEFGIGSPPDSPLPIQLMSLTAMVTNQGYVQLDWTTLTETNNYGFTVEKSAGTPDNYQPIPNSFIPGHGTTLVPHSYSYTDSSPGTARCTTGSNRSTSMEQSITQMECKLMC